MSSGCRESSTPGYRPPLLIALLGALLLAGCEREDREFRANPMPRDTEEEVALSPIAPGPNRPQERETGLGREYEENAYHLSQGKKLFVWFNCNGCHANGGGGMGPPLMDEKWIYGSEIENIVSTIREGRPNGMPSFRGRIPDDQIWQIAAYVRSMGRYVPKDAAPARSDTIRSRPAENRLPRRDLIPGGTIPPAAEMPQ
jgi:cytochrome c oxidase cbb3-type subunit 3